MRNRIRLLARAAELDAQTRSILETLGPESARGPYTRITITAARIEDLFPLLMQRYRVKPVGAVTVHNILDEEVRELTAGVFIQGYMDFPTESAPLPRFRPGERAELDLEVPS
jgi:hypothetical protein